MPGEGEYDLRSNGFLGESGHIGADHGQAQWNARHVADKDEEPEQVTPNIGPIAHQDTADQTDYAQCPCDDAATILELGAEKRGSQGKDAVDGAHRDL